MYYYYVDLNEAQKKFVDDYERYRNNNKSNPHRHMKYIIREMPGMPGRYRIFRKEGVHAILICVVYNSRSTARLIRQRLESKYEYDKLMRERRIADNDQL